MSHDFLFRPSGEKDLADFYMDNVKRTNARAPSLKKWTKLRKKVRTGGSAVAEQEWLSVDVDGPTMLAQEEPSGPLVFYVLLAHPGLFLSRTC